jgi:hypothetical protein
LLSYYIHIWKKAPINQIYLLMVKANLSFHEPEVVAIVRNNLYYFIELIWLENDMMIVDR